MCGIVRKNTKIEFQLENSNQNYYHVHKKVKKSLVINNKRNDLCVMEITNYNKADHASSSRIN